MNVLLVEDEEAIARPLATLLRAEGWTIETAATAARARELVSRLRAVLRRRGPKQVYSFGDLTLDARSAQVTVNGVPVALTAQEYRLLLLLTSQAGRVWERGQLLQALWDDGGAFVEDNTLTVTVKRLREKLGAEGGRIATVRGIGYRWEEKP